LILLAALAGLFGQGPLSGASVGEPGSALTLQYERIDRYKAPTRLQIVVGANSAQQGSVQLALNQAFLDRVEVQSVVPEPASVAAGDAEVIYTFDVATPDQPAQIRFDFEYDKVGPARGELRLEGGPTLQFSSFVFP
jgi:hypothetical protein